MCILYTHAASQGSVCALDQNGVIHNKQYPDPSPSLETLCVFFNEF